MVADFARILPQEEIIVDETPWGDKFGVATPVEPV